MRLRFVMENISGEMERRRRRCRALLALMAQLRVDDPERFERYRCALMSGKAPPVDVDD